MVLSVKILTAVRALEMPFYYDQLVKLALLDEYLTDVDKKDEIIKTLKNNDYARLEIGPTEGCEGPTVTSL